MGTPSTEQAASEPTPIGSIDPYRGLGVYARAIRRTIDDRLTDVTGPRADLAARDAREMERLLREAGEIRELLRQRDDLTGVIVACGRDLCVGVETGTSLADRIRLGGRMATAMRDRELLEQDILHRSAVLIAGLSGREG